MISDITSYHNIYQYINYITVPFIHVFPEEETAPFRLEWRDIFPLLLVIEGAAASLNFTIQKQGRHRHTLWMFIHFRHVCIKATKSIYIPAHLPSIAPGHSFLQPVKFHFLHFFLGISFWLLGHTYLVCLKLLWNRWNVSVNDPGPREVANLDLASWAAGWPVPLVWQRAWQEQYHTN